MLYSGTFNETKGGVFAAINSSVYLPTNYILHITGFGSNTEIDKVMAAIENLPDYKRPQVHFHGFLSNKEFELLINKCQIGLCTQDPSTPLNLTSFPSKILMYMSHGLCVVSGHNRAIEESAVGKDIIYYDSQTATSIADAILSIKKFDKTVIMSKLDELNKNFEQDLRQLLK